MRRFWRWLRWFWLDSREHGTGVYVEQVQAWFHEDFPDITPLNLPEVKPLTARVVKAKREKQTKPVLQMRRKA